MAAKIFGVDVETLLHLLIIFITGKHAIDLTGMKKSGATIHQQFEGDSAGGGVKTSSFVSQAQEKLRNLLPTFTRERHAALALKITSQTSILGELTEDMLRSVALDMQTLEEWEIKQFVVTMVQLFGLDGNQGVVKAIIYIANQLKTGQQIRIICQSMFLISKQQPVSKQIIDNLETVSLGIVQVVVDVGDYAVNKLESWAANYHKGYPERKARRNSGAQWFVAKLYTYATILVIVVTIVMIPLLYTLIANGGFVEATILIVVYVGLIVLLIRAIAPAKLNEEGSVT